MSVIKCKMCGGTLEINENQTTAVCEYCGTKQTLSKSNDEIMRNLFNRANNLRIKSEFDKAQEIYEKIVASDNTDSEAYWGIVLCKYGIEYIEDPKTFKRVQTCHRTQIESVLTDVDYQSALEHADSAQKAIYQAEAAEIDRLQKDILKIASKEKPFDVFICYKESDEQGKRTADSVIANDIYHQLASEGFKVFYAAITLEDKLGQEYEPYIFSALNSAKVMLVIGSKPEYFNAVWVKNEWGRFLKIVKNDRSKLLIPCYKDMDAYDLPEEFSHLQAQDMSKIGFINDVVRGIKKVLNPSTSTTKVKESVQISNSTGSNIAPLLKRAFMYLEDGEWSSADEYCEKILDQDPENADAYLGKLMAELGCRKREDLKDCQKPFDENINYKKTIRFGDEQLKSELETYLNIVTQRVAIAAERKRKKAKKIGIITSSAVAVLVAFALLINFVFLPIYYKNKYGADIISTSAQMPYFEVENGALSVNSEYKLPNSITIPAVFDEKCVTSIADKAFKDCRGLVSVTISHTVTSIGMSAFESCFSLTSVTIPDTVTSIGFWAFGYCSNLKDVYYIGTEAEWNEIDINQYGNSCFTDATIHYNSKGSK